VDSLCADGALRIEVESYFNGRKLELGESSQKKERQLLVKPCEFFRQKCLSRITADDVLRFREWRSGSGVGPAIINIEVGVIRRMLKRAKRWHLFGADIRPLKEPRSVGRALTFDEKLKLLGTAGQNEEWQRAEAAMSLALCTTMRGCEIKRLQWRDIDFLNRAVLVRTSKTEAGQRLIPMNDETHEIVMRLRERAKRFNGIEPSHYVFPACEHGHIDPTRSQKSFRTAWRNLTKAVPCPACGKLQQMADTCINQECKADIRNLKSPLAGLRFHDLRHHAITELAESQVSDQPSWPSPVMSAQRCWLDIRTYGVKREAAAAITPFRRKSLRASGEWHRIVLQEHRQRAAADSPQPIEHRTKHQEDRQCAHRRCREWLGKNSCHPLTDREK